ncbi:MAG: RidA family protein [Bacteroidales bacterium]|nr:RidA family protein [Bacteroidales bacterium]
MKKIIKTSKAPEAIGPYSQAVETNGILFISGQIPVDPDTNSIAEGGIEEQTKRVLMNIQAILKDAEYSLNDVVKCTCYMKNLGDFQLMNKIYAEFFADNPPARATFEVARLPKDVLIEIDAIAAK